MVVIGIYNVMRFMIRKSCERAGVNEGYRKKKRREQLQYVMVILVRKMLRKKGCERAGALSIIEDDEKEFKKNRSSAVKILLLRQDIT
jgi:hypothetical protein